MGSRTEDVVLEMGVVVDRFEVFGNMGMKLFQFGLDLVGTSFGG